MSAPAMPRDRPADPGDRRRFVRVIAILTVIALARLVAAAVTDLSPDEAYYFQWSQFPALGYFDHPPMIAWWTAASVALLGDTAFGIRFVSVMAIVATSLVAYAIAHVLFDNRRIAARATLWTSAIVLLGAATLATPDAPAILFWSLTVLAVATVVRTGEGRWWLVVGALAGLGVLSKFTNLFLGLGIVALLIAHRDLRHWFASAWLWAGGLMALVVAAPMLWWNAGNDWITFAKQFVRVGAGEFDPLNLLDFVIVQPIAFNVVMVVFVALAAGISFGHNRRDVSDGLSVLLWTSLPIVAYMAIAATGQKIQGNWLAPVFPPLAIAAAAAAESARHPLLAALRALVFPFGIALSALGLVAAAAPAGTIPYRYDIGQIMRGWDDLADRVANIHRDNDTAWIAASRYFVAAELDYHLRERDIPVILVRERRRHDFAPPPPGDLVDKPALLVTSGAAPETCFETIVPLGEIKRMSGDEAAQTLLLYRVEGAHPDIFKVGCDGLPPSG